VEPVTVIGLVAAAFTTFAYVPQAVQTIKTKNTKSLSLLMYVIMTIGIVLWLSYGILLRDLPIIFANTVTLIFAGIILILKIKYK
jgi:MtN3 and saliva related transmembrane protein